MPFKNLAIHRDLEIDASIEDVLWFVQERESIRKKKEANLPRPWTDDETLHIGRFNNVFREDDKTSAYIYKEVESQTGYGKWRSIFIGRYINRVDRLSKLYPLRDDFETQLRETLDPKQAFTNSTAYQLHSGIGKVFGVKGAKEATYLIDRKCQVTLEAMLKSKSLLEATHAVSKAFGGYINFMAYQCAVDWALTENDEALMNSEIYEGIGANATNNAINMDAHELAEYLNTHWSDRKRKLYAFDAEGIMCEFRKYHKRKQYGFQSATSKYRENFLGEEKG